MTKNQTAAAMEADVAERRPLPRWAITCASLACMLVLWEIFGRDNFFLEVQDQGLEIQKPVNRGLVRLSRELEIPLVATNDCHYLTRADSRAQDVLVCIQTNRTISDPNRMHFSTDQFYFKTAEEMARVLGELPERLAWPVEIATRCEVRCEPAAGPFRAVQVPAGVGGIQGFPARASRVAVEIGGPGRGRRRPPKSTWPLALPAGRQ